MVDLRHSGHLESVIFAFQEVPYGVVGRARSTTRREGVEQYGSLLIKHFQWFFPTDNGPKVAWCVPKRFHTTHHLGDNADRYGIHISIAGRPTVHLYNWYCPPGPGTHAQAWPAISHFWQQHRLPANSIICGDFNAHPTQWDTDSVFRRGGRTTQTHTVFFQQWLENHPEIRVADDPTTHTFHAHNTEGTHPDAIMYKGPDLPPLEITWTAVPITGIRNGHTINSVSTHCNLSVIPRETLLLPNSLIDKWAEALTRRMPGDFWHVIWTEAEDLDTWVREFFDYSRQAIEDVAKPTSLKAFVWWWNDQTDVLINSDWPDKL
ncbi:hypothetical protein ACEPAI_534 [Sanghuangporus weigelae]